MSARAADKSSSRRFAQVAVLAQLAKLALALLAGTWFSDYDASTSLVAGLCNKKDGQIYGIPAASLVWDSMFFATIACRGYEHEQQYAFFPLLPALLRPFKADINAMVAFGLCISSITAAASAVLFSTLATSVLEDKNLAALSVLLYIINPASVFHTAVYTESLFGFCTLLGLNALYLKQSPTSFGFGSHSLATHARLWAASACFMLSTATRSNGIVNAGFLMHAVIQGSIHQLRILVSPDNSSHKNPATKSIHKKLWVLLNTAILLVSGTTASIVVSLPLILHQLHAHALFCKSAPLAASNPAVGNSTTAIVIQNVMKLLWRPLLDDMHQVGMETPTLEPDHWCHKKPAWKPTMYGYIQGKYWGVGLFKYWQLSQIPNFVLATPVLLLSLSCIATYARYHWRHLVRGGFAWNTRMLDSKSAQSNDAHIHTAARKDRTQHETAGEHMSEQAVVKAYGLRSRRQKPASGQHSLLSNNILVDSSEMETLGQQTSTISARLQCSDTGFFSPDVAVFAYPLAFQAACALIVMHVQVSTRFLSTSPALFWYIAYLLQNSGQAGASERRAITRAGYWKVTSVWMWCWSYILIGTVLFTNFYPWT